MFDAEIQDLMDDKLPHRRGGEVELIDLVIRTFDYCKGFGYGLNAHAIKSGIMEFDDLDCVLDFIDGNFLNRMRRDIATFGASFLHRHISQVVEAERKSNHDKAGAHLLLVLLYSFVYAEIRGYQLQETFDEKMQFNAERADHKHEARIAVGGKTF